jgi:signal transduction histidine kinase
MDSFFTDLHTVLFLTYLTNAALSSLLAWSGRNFHGAWFWVLAQSLLAAGTVSDALPPQTPSWIPLILGNGAYAASCLVYSHSVWLFRFSRAFPRWLYFLIPIQLLSFVFALNQPYLVRALVFSSWMTLGALATGALLLWRVERRFWLSNTLTALPFLFLGVFSWIRVVHLFLLAGQNQAYQVPELNVAYVTGAILLSTITLFGYFMMTGIQGERVVQQMGEEIRGQNHELVEAGRAKDLFFAIVAHDLRGPIGGAARYVRKHLYGKMTGLEPKFAQVETLSASLEKTNDFLEKLLWWSRSQLKDWAPKKVRLPLETLLEQSLSLIRSAADLKEISIQVQPPPFPVAWGDVESIQLILGNLLSNAVKFSFPGKSIRILAVEMHATCRVTVEDEGVGMDQRSVDRLFRIEDKLTTPGTSDEQGGGLGLILAQSLAQRNDGRITIESTPGVGTKAHLWLPITSLRPEARS